MKKNNTFCALAFLVCCSLINAPVFAQTDLQQRVFILGNFADIPDKSEFLTQLERIFNTSSAPFTLVLNGDMVSQKVKKEGAADQLAPLHAVIDLVNRHPEGTLVMVPGDRDWNAGQRGGEKSVVRLEDDIKDYWDDMDGDRFHWAGDNACPGPEDYEVAEGLVIAAINTQWWNHPYDKPQEADAECDGLTADNLKEAIDDIIEENRDKNLLIVGHHPIVSLGNYGGYFSLWDQLSPLPVIGSFRTAYHANAGNQFDLANPRLQVYINLMETLLHAHDNLIYASGHEVNQQILTFGNNYLVNSGAPTKAKFATSNKNTVYSAAEAGIMELDYAADGQVEVVLWTAKSGQDMQRGEARTLFQSACSRTAVETGLVNTAYVPCKDVLVKADSMEQHYTETVEFAAGPEYKASAWKRLWFGDHYRDSWMQPVKVHYLDLDTTFGGLTIYKKGGGRQTTSLKFKSGNGTEFTFRSVNKDPVKSLTYDLQQTIAADVIRDQTSSQQPYGAMAVSSLLDKVDILHAHPKLYLLPDDPKLGPFRPKYGGLFGMLEENPGKKNNEDQLFGQADEIDKSAAMYRHFYKHQRTKIDLEEFVRARLFDMLIGDWSKHEDNWKWAGYDRDDFRVYRPIPRDRDHAFSRQDGIINWIADRPFGIPTIQNFGYHFHGIRSLTYQARYMDRFLLQEAGRDIFLEQARYLQEHISEADIDYAVRQMPPEIYELSGKVIAAKLKSRIGELEEAALVYYDQLADEVDVTGSNDREFFEISYLPEGNLKITVYSVEDDEKGKAILYDRTFLPSETDEVRLWGLGDDDIFSATGGSSPIRVRAFGGPGEDHFHDQAQATTLMYDKGDGTEYDLQGGARNAHFWNKDMYEYSRMRFGYNYSSPVLGLGYSGALGVGLNLGYFFKIRKFGKEDYASTHTITVGATTEGNKRASYQGRFHQVIRRWDLLLGADVNDTSVRNRFFGIGNNTENFQNEFGVEYFQPKLSSFLFSLGLRRDFWQQSYFSVRLGVEQQDSREVENTLLAENFENIYGAHQKWKMIPMSLTLDLDFRDEPGLPYRGIRALVGYDHYNMLNEVPGSNTFGTATGEIEYYVSSRNRHPVTIGLRVGGAFSYGDVPWYKLPTLGSTNGLRGFVETRFAGTSSAYFNSEIRYQLAEKTTSIVPVKIGIKAFYDRGRVFVRDLEERRDWHAGYGFGVYLVPLDESLAISLSLGFSEEESAYPIFSIGTPLR
ncbi:BamA/TamA family outer membrane protein [Flavilitoribacter nigricans]|uniref:Bacterial surface antigen (D15) domain-containing protein n=1 Tax=Flavilitoribacter nigricans (strain ATCC 23147 / DSM 23189 / NBRC 102662 / NCIMB 1420 / SS-2) TaxID=1122177 RepID=A0A2D0N530_FLAN2|nr:BamA/TamA family outer membrane protein [Flavilitoribacter nigricans]PHN03642.1 hypothetical protein CRP01_25630 [Flavilitoribacter nigricans DSM 23189 = NBRC 102662]